MSPTSAQGTTEHQSLSLEQQTTLVILVSILICVLLQSHLLAKLH